jgi:hypothetical protein
MSPAVAAVMAGNVHRIRARARNGETYELHATLNDGRQVRQRVASRYTSPSAVVRSGGAFRMEPVR